MLDKVPPSRLVPAPGQLRSVIAASNQDDSPASAMNLAIIFWRRRWVIVLAVILCLGGAFFNLKHATPQYASDSLLYVHESSPRIISDAVVSKEAANLFDQCELIKSTAILSSAIDSTNVAGVKMLLVDNPVGLLKSQIMAEPGKQGSLLRVSIITSDPTDASIVVNAVVQAYIEYQKSKQKSSASHVLEILEGDKNRYEKQWQESSDKLVKFKQDNPELAMTTEHGNIVTEQFAALSEKLTQAKMESLELQLKKRVIDATKDDPVRLRQYISTLQGQFINGATPQLTPAQMHLSQVLSEERLMREKYLPESPELKDFELTKGEALDAVNAEEHKSLSDFVAVVNLNLEQAEARVEELTRQVEAVRKLAVSLNSKSAEFDQLTTEKGRNERMLDTLDNRIKELNVTAEAGGTGGIDVSILETAKPNPVPISPNPTKIMSMGLVVGLMLGMGGAFLIDFMDQRLRSAEEIGKLLDLPVLGTVAHINGKLTAPQRGQEVHLHPRSDVAEAYRTIRTAIYFGVPEDQGKTILITSPAPGDGKSTMASNVAIAMAQAGRHVLLIDADCRRPTQHKTFGIKAEVGLSTVLLGRTPLADAIQHTSTDNLDILPCGPLPTNPSELLDSQTFLDLLKLNAGKYDNVIIDSPPVVPVTDARILAASCDVTVLVLRAEKSTRSLAQHACDALNSVGAHVLGVAVNDVPRGGNGAYYYAGYGYGAYRYGYSSNGATLNGNGTSKEMKAITVVSKPIDA